MRDFLDVADIVRESQKPASQSREYFDLVFRAISELDPVFAKSTIEVDNIESVFATFEMAELFGRLGTLTSVEVGRLVKAIKHLIGTTLEDQLIFPTNSGRVLPPHSYQAFVKLLAEIRKPKPGQNVTKPVTVMTFNYDLALDYAFHFNRTKIDYCLAEGEPVDGISVLKLHGSFNWTRCLNPNCKKISVTTFEEVFNGLDWFDPYNGNVPIKLRFTVDLPQCKHCAAISSLQAKQTPDALIIPPTWNKTQHYAEIRNVWSVAARHLSEAENIVVIGYSLPETDHFFHYLYALGAVGATRLKRFMIFNPDQSVTERFARLLGPVAKDRMMPFQKIFSESIPHLRDTFAQPT